MRSRVRVACLRARVSGPRRALFRKPLPRQRPVAARRTYASSHRMAHAPRASPVRQGVTWVAGCAVAAATLGTWMWTSSSSVVAEDALEQPSSVEPSTAGTEEERQRVLHNKQRESTPDLADVITPTHAVDPLCYKVVLTGGPCGGKTTAVSLIQQRLAALGYQIYVVPEAATLLFTGGARYGLFAHSEDLALSFEAQKVKTQISLEDSFVALAKASNKPSVIICDRGTMDSQAYVGVEKFAQMCDQNEWSVVNLRERRYDAVIHLVSTAIGAEEFYTTTNNAARRENVSEATSLDIKILNAWIGHPRIIIIDNSTDFSGKMNRVVKNICRLLGVPRPAAVERKFVLDTSASTKIPHEVPYEKAVTETTFLQRPVSTKTRNQQGYVFLKRRGQGGTNAHFYSAKHVFDNGKEAIVERSISALEFATLMQQFDPERRRVYKRIKSFLWKNQYFELQTYQEPHRGFVILKTETDSPDRLVELPPWLSVVGEVTNDPAYSTFELSRVEQPPLYVAIQNGDPVERPDDDVQK